MRVLSFSFICFLYSSFLCAQSQSNTDSFNKSSSLSPDHFDKNSSYSKARSFFLSDELDSTLLYSLKALSQKTASKKMVNFCHYFRGVSLKKKMLFDPAQNELSQISADFEFNHLVQIQLGGIALEQKRYRKAINHYKQLGSLPKELQLDFDQSAVYQNIGLCFLHLGEFDNSQIHLFKSLSLQKKAKDTVKLISSFMNIGNLYYEQYKDSEAMLYFDTAYHLSKHTNNFTLKQNAALNMSILHENNQNLSLALTYRKEYESWRDSLSNQNEVWALAEAEKAYAAKQNQKQIHILTIENELREWRQNVLLVSITLLILIGIIGIHFYRRQSKSNAIIVDQKKNLDRLNNTKNKLFAIVSHDLRSSISALQIGNDDITKLLKENKPDELQIMIKSNTSMTNRVYSLLDNLLNWSMLQTDQLYFKVEPVPLHSIVKQVAYNYVILMKYKGINFSSNIPEDLLVNADPDSLKIILRNLLDNAIKYTKTNGTIYISADHPKIGRFTLKIADNGIGMDEQTRIGLLSDEIQFKGGKRDSGTGLGMLLCREMIAKNDGNMRIESQEGSGTTIIIELNES